jgi:hypothetical protein
MENIKKIQIFTGIVIAVVGLGFHFTIPGTSRSGFAILIPANGTTTERIHLILADTEYEFKIELMGSANTTCYLLTPVEYQSYIEGTPLTELDALITTEGENREQYESMITDSIDRYVIAVNENDYMISVTYFYAVIPPTYFSSITIAFIGIFISLGGFCWFLTGWKRYFAAVLSIHVLVFYLRIFTLFTYSLDEPEIFNTIFHTELYNDYQFFYLSWVPSLWEGNWAYSAEVTHYLYPPLWIFTVSIFGWVPSWLPGVILFAFNVATGPLVYLISQELTGNDKRSIFAMLLYLFNPLTLFYGSFMWLNPALGVFFSVLAFYLAVKEKPDLSIVSLGIATLYKQFSVILFPIIAILFIKKRENITSKGVLADFMRYTFIYSLVIGIVSLPFLIVSPNEFLNQVFHSNRGWIENLRVFIPELWMPVHTGTFWLWLGAPKWFTDILAFLTYNYVFLALCGIFVYVTYGSYKVESKETISKSRGLFASAILWSIIAVLCVQAFFPRGVYKFYLLLLTPFISILFDYENLDLTDTGFEFQKHHLFPIAFSLAVFLCYRFVYLWLINFLTLFYLWNSGEFHRISSILRCSRKPEREWDEIYSDVTYPDIEANE